MASPHSVRDPGRPDGHRSDAEDRDNADRLPVTEPRSIEAIGRLAEKFRDHPAFQGADVGADVRLSDGRHLWVFGDTVRAADFPEPRIVHNSIVVVGAGSVEVVLPGDAGAAIPDRADGVGYWPMSVGRVSRGGHDLVAVGLMRVRSVGWGVFDFALLGPAVAFFRVPPGRSPQLVEVRDLGPDSDDRDRPMWGAAVATDATWVYLYGTRPGGLWVFGSSLHLARSLPRDLAEPTAWEFWTGRGWARDPDLLGTLVEAEVGVSQILSVFERDGWWYAVSKRGDVFGTDLLVWKAPAPTGPFVAGPVLATIPSEEAGVLRYMPLAHPELPAAPGAVVVSYSRNVSSMQTLLEDPSCYRPVFVEVPLP